MSEPALRPVEESGGIDHAPGIERAFDFVPAEGACPVPRIEGRVPASLRGTVYLNGPARFQRDGRRYRHWLDGDGMVCALRFGGDGVRFANRFVRSTKWLAEEEAGAFLCRAFGTCFPGDRLVRGIALESPVNVSVYPFAGTLLAFGEQGLPWELDPVTLETRGPFNFGGALNPVSPFAAHPKIDPATGELVNFGVSFSRQQPALSLYRFDASGRPVLRRRFPLPYPCSLHDFALSPRFAVFYLAPYLLDMELFAGGGTLMESLSWEPERGSRLFVVDRRSGEPVADLSLEGRYCLHTVNAFEQGDRLVVDVVELERPVYDQYEVVPDLFTSVAEGGPVRFEVDLAAGRLTGRREIAYRRAPDFPAIDPGLSERRAEDLWMLGISTAGRSGRKFFDELVHLSWQAPEREDLWRAPAGSYLGGEPIFLPDPERPGAGWAVCQLFEADRRASSWLLFDAFDVAAGPVARLHLDSPIHLGFHASFHPEG
jgi:all-trans-8'-apo-beta-carotenal 15,15'-oxygenase